ncbi:MAG TPA: VC0807 family protein [Acidimicrobiales bacterium]|nr:VC0807 family protein [Acidimicrobiales bacterium]
MSDDGLAVAEVSSSNHHILHMPSPRDFVRHALPSILESTIVPGLIFYAVLLASGFKGAVVAALAWSYLAAGRRAIRRERMPALLLLGIVLLTARTLISFVTGSAFLYFIQPTAGTAVVAVLFGASALLGRPIIERLAHDFCPLDPEVMARPFVRRFFLRLSVLWSIVLLTNAGFVLWLLFESSLKAFVVERAVVSYVLTGGGIVLSTLWFVRTMRGAGISVRWSLKGMPAVVPVEVAVDGLASAPNGNVGESQAVYWH